MIWKLKLSLVLIILSALFHNCQHELNFPVNEVNGTALFSFYGSPGACVHPVVTGSYETGTALGSTNTVSQEVNVAATGTYTVSTATVNGIKFTASGTFTATGQQTIFLTGSGTPVAPGTFSYIPGLNGCSFPVTISNSILSGSGIFTFDGAPGPCTNLTVGGKYSVGNILTATNRIKIDVNVIKTGGYSIKTAEVNGISFSGTGSFTTLGYDVVTLIGTGTPTVEGLFIFTPSNNGCPFAVRVGASVIANDFIKCNIGGVDRTFNMNLLGALIDPTIFSFTGNETFVGNSPQIGLAISKSPVVTTGIYNQLSPINANNFCVAKYNDGVTPTEWTIALLGQTGGFTVNITSYTTNRIEGTFSGTLYGDDGKGNDPKVITNGQFSLPY